MFLWRNKKKVCLDTTFYLDLCECVTVFQYCPRKIGLDKLILVIGPVKQNSAFEYAQNAEI